MVITYGPNRVEDPEIIASNHPTYTYLYALFGGKFRPTDRATAYWTHLRKCFIKDERGHLIIDDETDDIDRKTRSIDKKAMKKCSKAYLI